MNKASIRAFVHRHTGFLFALGLLIFCIYEISFYIFKTYRAFFNSDSAIANILAEEMVLSESFFPSHWWYVNNDLWVFYKQILLIPWVLLGKNGYFAHAFSVFAVSLFMVFIIYKFLRSLMLSRTASLMGSAVVCIGYSPMYLRELYGEGAYTWYFIFMIGFMFIFRKLSPHVISKTTQMKAFLLFITLLYLLVLANPVRFFVYYIAPFFGALICSLFLMHHGSKVLKRNIKQLFTLKKITIIILACIVMGFGVFTHLNLLERLQSAGGANNAVLVPLEQLPVHAAHAFLGLLNFIGAEWGENIRASSLEGGISLIKFFLYPCVLVIPLFYIKKAFHQMSSTERFFVLFSYVGFALVFTLYSTTSLHEHAWAARNNIRYVSPFLMMILLCNVIMWRFFSPFAKFILSICLSISLLLSWNYVSPKEWRGLVDERIALVEDLKSHDLKFGYAEYWHSHIYTVFSNGEVDIRPMQFDAKGISLVKWLSSDTWYQKEATQGKVFFLLTDQDIKEFEAGAQAREMPDPIEVFKSGKYSVYVFEKNPLYEKRIKAKDSKKKRIISAQ